MRAFLTVLLLISLAGRYLHIICKILPVVPAPSITAAVVLKDSAEAVNLQAPPSTDISISFDTLEQALSKYAAADPSSSLTLPTCESLMRNAHLGADGSFLTRSPTTWALRHDGSRELQLPLTCRLTRYTSKQARKCLNQRHLAFIGDSLTRYQFLSLAYFVERGEFPPRFGTSSTQPCSHIKKQGIPTCSPDDEPNVCMEGDWQSWQKFHSALGGSTNGSMFHGRLECGCARREGVDIHTTENAQYISDSGTKISYVSEVGWGDMPGPIHGWNFTNCAEKGTCRTTQEGSDSLFNRSKQQDWDWNEPLHQALNGTLQQVLHGVDIAIYNRGHWGILKKELIDKIMFLVRNWVGDKGRCFYKTTTAGRLEIVRLPELSYIKEATFAAGCGFLDFGHLTQEFDSLTFSHPAPPKEEGGKVWNFQERRSIYWDSVHFTPWVYEELNNVLLNVLCNGKATE